MTAQSRRPDDQGHTKIRTALVLGGSSDIATSMVSALKQRGLEKVLLGVRDVDGLQEAVGPGNQGDPTPESVIVAWNALDIDAHRALALQAAETLGTIDLVICAVGMLGHHAGVSMSAEEVDQMVRTNFAGPAAALSGLAAQMVEQRASARPTDPPATIVVVSSVAAARPRKSNFVYGASKGGLDAFARGLGDALADTGVRVIVIRPGFVRTRMTEGLEPAPFATDAQSVADALVRALDRRAGSQVVWVPRILGPLFAVLANLPTRLWRRIAGDR